MLHPETETEAPAAFTDPPRQHSYTVPETWRLAPLWRRFGALIIDSVILGVIGYVLSTILFFGLNFSIFSSEGDPWPISVYIILVGAINVFSIGLRYFYYVYFYSTTGQTIGKKLLGIAVVRADQRPLGLGSSLKRSLACLLVPSLTMNYATLKSIGFANLGRATLHWSYWLMVGIALLMVLDHLWALWNKDNQTLHDMFAGTVVVQT